MSTSSTLRHALPSPFRVANRGTTHPFGAGFRSQLLSRQHLAPASARHASSSARKGGGGGSSSSSGSSNNNNSGSQKGGKAAGGTDGGKLVLDKPDRFRPPSHPARLRSAGSPSSTLGRTYGPETTAAERAAMRKKQYPNMMPPDGSWMHWFLTNRTIHVWITMTLLFGFGAWAMALNIKQTSPFAHLLPAARDWARHPLDSAHAALQVAKLSAEHTSRATAERRKRDLDEVAKRRAFRVAHGLEGMDGIDQADPVFAAALASRLEREQRERERVEAGTEVEAGAGGEDAVAAAPAVAAGVQERRKKWFGIW